MEQTFYPHVVSGRENLVLLGETGSGKSEIALNITRLLAGQQCRVDFFDLDQTKPLMRARAAAEKIAFPGVEMHWEDQLLDAPVVTGGVRGSLADPGVCTILDVGGLEIGARMIGRFSQALKQTGSKVLYIINPYRPWSKDTENLLKTMEEIRRATRLEISTIIANPHLGHQTSPEEFLAGMEMIHERVPDGFTVEGACARQEIAAAVSAKAGVPVLPMDLMIWFE